jgi:hypothetical protein
MGTNVALTRREFCKRTKYCILAKCLTEESCSHQGSRNSSVGSYEGLQEPVSFCMKLGNYCTVMIHAFDIDVWNRDLRDPSIVPFVQGPVDS